MSKVLPLLAFSMYEWIIVPAVVEISPFRFHSANTSCCDNLCFSAYFLLIPSLSKGGLNLDKN